MWMWRWVVIRYDFAPIEPLITMYCVRNWLTMAQFWKAVKIAPATIRNWKREWSIPVMMVQRLKKYIPIDFTDLRAVNTNGVE